MWAQERSTGDLLWPTKEFPIISVSTFGPRPHDGRYLYYKHSLAIWWCHQTIHEVELRRAPDRSFNKNNKTTSIENTTHTVLCGTVYKWTTSDWSYLGSWWQTDPYCLFFPFNCGVLECIGHFTHTAKVLCNKKKKEKQMKLKWWIWMCTVRTKKIRTRVHTEHSSSEVWTQPERSLRTQQAELRSIARFSLMRSCTCLSRRMHGEYLAPKWIRASWEGRGWNKTMF